jgi:hypothetical protein
MRFQGGDRRSWRLHYCGTCKSMGRQYGQASRLLLNHDAVFLAELLTSLQKSDAEQWGPAYASWNCLHLPKTSEIPPAVRYVSAVTVLLAGYKAADHAVDSGRRIWAVAQRLLSPTWRKARRELAAMQFPVDACDAVLAQQQALEAGGATFDAAAVPTAEATALVFRHGARIAGVEEEGLAAIGYRFGALTYAIDAWQDFESDRRTGAFNALPDRAWGAAKIQADAAVLAAMLPEPFALRLRTNVAATLGLRILHSCRPPHVGLRDRFRHALERTRSLGASPLAFGAVLAMAFLFPSHARTAKSSQECLSLGMNLMALGSLFAMASTPEPPLPQRGTKEWDELVAKTSWKQACQNDCGRCSNCGSGCGSGCNCAACACDGCTECSCDCCCEGCCDACDCS